MKIAIVGLGFVGSAIEKSFSLNNIDLILYDKYKNNGIGKLENILNSDILFLCLPTLFNKLTNKYDKTAIHEVSKFLQENNYKGLVILKSTVEPETTEKLAEEYNLKYVHNPEFLTARTAFEDFHNQNHIVLGYTENCDSDDKKIIEFFYNTYYPNAEISICKSIESESMKIMCNSFYASKVQLFNEFYLLCKKNNSDFETVKNLMLKNNWINKMHTDVPGPDGKLSYGGACFPKDTNALSNYMKIKNAPSKVLDSVIEERNLMRQESVINLTNS